MTKKTYKDELIYLNKLINDMIKLSEKLDPDDRSILWSAHRYILLYENDIKLHLMRLNKRVK